MLSCLNAGLNANTTLRENDSVLILTGFAWLVQYKYTSWQSSSITKSKTFVTNSLFSCKMVRIYDSTDLATQKFQSGEYLKFL